MIEYWVYLETFLIWLALPESRAGMMVAAITTLVLLCFFHARDIRRTKAMLLIMQRDLSEACIELSVLRNAYQELATRLPPAEIIINEGGRGGGGGTAHE